MTLGLLLVCVISLTQTQNLESEVRARADAKLDEAIEYFDQHPYLEPPDLLHARLAQRADGNLQGDRSGGRRMPAPVRRRHQHKLDELVVASFAPFAELPNRQRGLNANESTVSSWMVYPLLHDGWLHLIGNGFLLLLVGTFLERAWRSPLYAGFLVATALLSGWTFILANPGLADPLIGMVGIVAGLLGAFCVRFAKIWRDPRYTLSLLAGFGWLIAPLLAGWEPSVARMLTSAATGGLGPSFGAVAGGFGVGVASAIAVALSGIERNLPESTVVLDSTQTSELIDSARGAHEDGRAEDAQEILADLLELQPNNLEALLSNWQVALDLGQHDDAAASMTRVVELEVRAGEQQGAMEHWLELVSRDLDGRVEPQVLIRLALLFAAANRTRDAVHAFESALARAQGDDIASIAARVARAARDVDSQIAEDAAWRALSEPSLALEERQGLEALLAQLGTRTGDAAARIEKGCSEDSSDLSAADEQESADGLENGPSSEPTFAPDLTVDLAPEPEAGPGPDGPLVQWEDPELTNEVSEFDEPLQTIDNSDNSDNSDDALGDEASNVALHPTPIALEFTSRQIEVLECNPVELCETGLDVEVEAGVKRRIPFGRMQAICVAAIAADGARPVLIVDLILNWNEGAQDELKLIRLRSDRFDPRRLVSADCAALDAMRQLIDQLLSHSRAIPLPDLQAARGYPFVSFNDVASYQHGILSVDPDPSNE